VYTHNDTLAFVWGDRLVSDESGTRLIGHRSFVSKPDTILLRDIVAVSYDADVVVITTSRVRHDWRAGEWRLLYEDDHPAALVRAGDGTRLPLDGISHMSIDGGLNGFFVFGLALLGVFAYFAFQIIAVANAF
jgi:hypothetical protein